MDRRTAKGFTLMEMLIVIAIIAVLIAIAIPVFSGQMEKAKQATDLANERGAYAAARAEWLTGEDNGKVVTYYYTGGSISKTLPSDIAGYGQSGVDASKFSDEIDAEVSGIPNPNNGKPSYLTIWVAPNGSMKMSWDGNMAAWSLIPGKNVSGGDGDNNLWYKSDPASKAKKREVYDSLRASSNAERVAADQGILNAFADYFNGLTVDEAKAILGESKFNEMSRNGSRLLAYCVDDAYSVRLNPDQATKSADYLNAIGYDPEIYITEGSNNTWKTSDEYTFAGNNYVDQYLFTSDQLIDKLSSDKNVNLKFSVSDGKITNAQAWINGTDISSNLS